VHTEQVQELLGKRGGVKAARVGPEPGPILRVLGRWAGLEHHSRGMRKQGGEERDDRCFHAG
jgi:hypothetical protein